jgi:hypothetical protein
MRKLIVLIAFLGAATAASAADQTILGKTLGVKDPSAGLDPAKRSIVLTAKEVASPNMIVGDPTATDGSGGGALEIAVEGTTPSGQVFDLPQGTSASTGKPFWTAIGTTGFKYSDPAGEQGPVGLAIIQRSTSGNVVIKAKVSGKRGTLLVTPPNAGTSACVGLTLGTGDRYSIAFGADSSITNNGAKLFLAKNPQTESVCDPCVIDNGGCDEIAPCTFEEEVPECGPCPGGYTGHGSTTCNDINECATNNGGCFTTCTNMPGSRACSPCPAGYTGTGDTPCIDINECATNNGGCETSPVVTCTNSPGSRTCGTCPAGYTGTGDTMCNDVNECATNNGGCSTTPQVTCINLAGSQACGPCPSGYTGPGTFCADINECATNNGGCGVGMVCENQPPGSYTCP